MKISNILLIGRDVSYSLAGAPKVKVTVTGKNCGKELGKAEIAGNTFDVRKLPGVVLGESYKIVLTPTDGKADGPSQTIEVRVAKNGTVSAVSGFANQAAPAAAKKPTAAPRTAPAGGGPGNPAPPAGHAPQPPAPPQRPFECQAGTAVGSLRAWLESEHAAQEARAHNRETRSEGHFARIHQVHEDLAAGLTQIGVNSTEANSHLRDLKAGQVAIVEEIRGVKTEVTATKTAVTQTTAAVIEHGNKNQRHLVVLMAIIIGIAALIAVAWITDRTAGPRAVMQVAPVYDQQLPVQRLETSPRDQSQAAPPQHGVWLPRPTESSLPIDNGHFTAMTSVQQGFGPNTVTYYDGGPAVIRETHVIVERQPVLVQPYCPPSPYWRNYAYNGGGYPYGYRQSGPRFRGWFNVHF